MLVRQNANILHGLAGLNAQLLAEVVKHHVNATVSVQKEHHVSCVTMVANAKVIVKFSQSSFNHF